VRFGTLVCLTLVALSAGAIPATHAQGATYTFGMYYPPGPPFSASDSEKADAPTIQSTVVNLDDYPVGHEMVRARADWYGPSLVQDTPCNIEWNNGFSILFVYQYTFRAGWNRAYFDSWIGHKSSGEIDGPGTYGVRLHCSGLFDRTITFEVQQSGLPPPILNTATTIIKVNTVTETRTLRETETMTETRSTILTETETVTVQSDVCAPASIGAIATAGVAILLAAILLSGRFRGGNRSTSTRKRHCTRCGNEVRYGDLFCRNCGTRTR